MVEIVQRLYGHHSKLKKKYHPFKSFGTLHISQLCFSCAFGCVHNALLSKCITHPFKSYETLCTSQLHFTWIFKALLAAFLVHVRAPSQFWSVFQSKKAEDSAFLQRSSVKVAKNTTDRCKEVHGIKRDSCFNAFLFCIF